MSRDVKALATDAIGFALMMAAFFGWYIVLCPPARAASNIADADAMEAISGILATLFVVVVALALAALFAIAAGRALFPCRTSYDEHGQPRVWDREDHHP